METKKIKDYVDSLTKKQLTKDQQAILLVTDSEQPVYGGNNDRCKNESASCDLSINDWKCTNDNSSNCKGSLNKKCKNNGRKGCKPIMTLK